MMIEKFDCPAILMEKTRRSQSNFKKPFLPMNIIVQVSMNYVL